MMFDQPQFNPIRRKEALLRFSREHHYGLLLIWKIREGIKKNIPPERISDFILYFFEHDLKEHFHKEEVDLFARIESNNELIQTALKEHQQLTAMVEQLRKDKKNTELITKFSDELDKHIRFEERTLFNEIQNSLSDKDLIELEATHLVKPYDVSDDWDDKFWIITT
ncbi:MAG: hemerythrin domain-containing protein [Bacteroidia bacterium]|nr:hemerythrin domain-containing protein [Bacteroidia bacterium]MCC7513850.1 hemerythrin domain-containing protein [Bacteroidia bacterium]MCE7954523.1 hemerythrin domain-containing protein [Bacteroidetes bacterium CHB6]HRV52791.1 hemerythrin domain-containing protein [Bacteroidia bacterium]